MSNSPVNHVGMTVAIDDLPPLMWHAELGNKLVDVWAGGNHRGVQLNDARESVEQWMNVYGQRCWLRQKFHLRPLPFITDHGLNDQLRLRDGYLRYRLTNLRNKRGAGCVRKV